MTRLGTVRSSGRAAREHAERPASGWPAIIVRVAGSVLLIATAAIHLDLYLTGYRTIPTIGWLFLLQVIAAFGLGLAVLAIPSRLVTSSRLAAAAGAGFALATLGGYLLSVWIGLFGFKEVRTGAGIAADLVEVAALAVLAALAIAPAPVKAAADGAAAAQFPTQIRPGQPVTSNDATTGPLAAVSPADHMAPVPGRLTEPALLALVIRHAQCSESDLDPDQWYPVSADPREARQEAAAAIAICTTCPGARPLPDAIPAALGHRPVRCLGRPGRRRPSATAPPGTPAPRTDVGTAGRKFACQALACGRSCPARSSGVTDLPRFRWYQGFR
jgi:hypothetical protein